MDTLTVKFDNCVCLFGLNIIIQGHIYTFNFVFKTETNNHTLQDVSLPLNYKSGDLSPHYKSQRQWDEYTRYTWKPSQTKNQNDRLPNIVGTKHNRN